MVNSTIVNRIRDTFHRIVYISVSQNQLIVTEELHTSHLIVQTWRVLTRFAHLFLSVQQAPVCAQTVYTVQQEKVCGEFPFFLGFGTPREALKHLIVISIPHEYTPHSEDLFRKGCLLYFQAPFGAISF